MSSNAPRRLLIMPNHDYEHNPPNSKRSPCPALNTLANHGYMQPPTSSRSGKDLSFVEVVNAIVFVYNLSYPLAYVLALSGFLTCGHLKFGFGTSHAPEIPWDPRKWSFLDLIFVPLSICLYILERFLVPRLVLDLSSLSCRGKYKITHDGAFVHPNHVPSTSPEESLVRELVEYASTTREITGELRGGLGLIDLARYHARRLRSVSSPPEPTLASDSISNPDPHSEESANPARNPPSMTSLHLQITQGECSLTWEVLRGHQCHDSASDPTHDRARCMLKARLDGVIPTERLRQWFGEERLPDGWWDSHGVRPSIRVGLLRARVVANFVGQLAKKDGAGYVDGSEGGPVAGK
ncbi:hypothetical protein CPC08DRAFT_822158 [Agrocybe pediades]|nr:hypothetical protein CPC08DRAFT_822158 [Agrocybe pediades]